MAGRAETLPLREARRRLVIDGLGILVSVVGFGLVFGLSARNAGLSLIEAMAFSTLTFAGSAQFAAVGLIAGGASWPAIIVLTAFLNARHLLYSAALAPWLTGVSRPMRAAMAHGLTDEAFAISLHHFRRLGRADVPGYWIAAGLVLVPWNIATVLGVLGGSVIPDPKRLGLDVIFPAAMAGLAVLLVHGRREIAASILAIAVAVGLALTVDPSVGVVAGGLLGPLVVVLLRPPSPAEVNEAVHPAEAGDPALGGAP